jgi:hypothetical protein
MARDFLQAWLVEGNAVAAMGYVSERAYACLAEDTPDPLPSTAAWRRSDLVNLKAATTPRSARLARRLDDGNAVDAPGLKAVRHADQAQYAIYEVRDDVAAGSTVRAG